METEAGGQLLELLLTGVPDKAIAAKLGVSERTVQRRVGRLMADAGAGNRMQLGRHAARLEYLSQGAEIPAHRPNERDLSLLALLFEGIPEPFAAQLLQISPRTVQRRVQCLMKSVSATSWAQLGWHATRCGWI
jgi:DNA-binding NarL/FixJ family response regulator